MSARLSDYRVLTFDCYGTLIDWETGIWDALQPLFAANDLPSVDRRRALALFGSCEHAQETETPDMPYPAILQHVHRTLAERMELESNAELDHAFGRSVPMWPAFPDSANALRYLATRYSLVILSNVDRESFAASNAKLGVRFDAIYTAEDIGSYKPSDANFEYLLHNLDKDLGLGRRDILHTAQSLLHDHAPANRFGLANAFIDRQRLSETGMEGAVAVPEERPETLFEFFSMGEMAEAVRGEVC
ncbi:MAG: haloacid dehalogenase type II [Pseudomonadota bacterium]